MAGKAAEEARDEPAEAAGGPVPAKNHDRYIVPGLSRGLQLLQKFNRDRRVMGLSELARALGLTRSTAFRLLYTLEMLGFVERDRDGRFYRLGSKVLTLGFEYLASLEVVEVARPALELLRDATGASAHLAVRDGADIIYLSRVPTRHHLTSTATLGGRRPAYATPMGRLLLCELPPATLSELYEGQKLKPYTDQTPTSLAALRALLAQDRAHGYVVSRGSFELGGATVAAPIRGPSGEIVAAIDISGPNSAFDLDALDTRLKDEVCGTALAISRRLGYRR